MIAREGGQHTITAGAGRCYASSVSDDKPKTTKREAVVFVHVDEPDRFADMIGDVVIEAINELRAARGLPPLPKD